MDKKALIIGAGISGLSAAKLLLAEGYAVTITDKKEKIDIEDKFLLNHKKLTWDLGSHSEKYFKEADLIVLSPGVAWDLKYLQEAKLNNKNIVGELELAATRVTAPILAITGSNGKTTATALLGYIFKALGRKVFVGGNIGYPLSELVFKKDEVEVIILELSSFQLETVKSFKAKIASILNISPDHLDRYDDMPAYFKTKTNIFKNQTPIDYAIINEDDVLSSKKNTTAKRYEFSRFKKVENGAYVANEKIVLVKNKLILAEKPWADFNLWGIHNQENVLAAAAMALAYGLEAPSILEKAAEFKSERHRIEFVGEYKGVSYYNDSKATNVGAVIKALENFKTPVYLIAGGREKALDFKPLYNPVKNIVKKLILIGEAQKNLAKALKGATDIVLAKDMAEAVKITKNNAQKGEVVLLSPACASYDMFKDYLHRGDVFTAEVKRQNNYEN